MKLTANIELLELAARILSPLLEDLVFLGGCATDLLVSDPGAPAIRATNDVDAIIEVASRREFAQLESTLRSLGLSQTPIADDSPICRWTLGGLKLDIMPTDQSILGFGNQWYGPALANATAAELPSGRRIQHVTAPYFVATKIDAFLDRGRGDYLSSHDFEDMMAVFDGRPDLADEVLAAPAKVGRFIADHCLRFLEDPLFHDALPGVIADAGESPPRVGNVIQAMAAIVEQFRN